jgi:hypothetical protein
VVLVVVLVTKFTHGAYLVVIAIPVLYAMMRSISRHYGWVRAELWLDDELGTLPSRVHAVVLVSTLHKPTVRALNFRPGGAAGHLDAITINVGDEETRALRQEWEWRGIEAPLKVVESPYRWPGRPCPRARGSAGRGVGGGDADTEESGEGEDHRRDQTEIARGAGVDVRIGR